MVQIFWEQPLSQMLPITFVLPGEFLSAVGTLLGSADVQIRCPSCIAPLVSDTSIPLVSPVHSSIAFLDISVCRPFFLRVLSVPVRLRSHTKMSPLSILPCWSLTDDYFIKTMKANKAVEIPYFFRSFTQQYFLLVPSYPSCSLLLFAY